MLSVNKKAFTTLLLICSVYIQIAGNFLYIHLIHLLLVKSPLDLCIITYFQVLSICVYHAINRVWYMHNGTGQEPIVYLTLTTLLLTLLAVGMAIGVVLAVGTLLFLQVILLIQIEKQSGCF